ncbi:MAG: hypothetical protein DMD62_10800 [Gemmatimonadetes bacterium]|nr:MAG: hypothetical protein DMD62_10800 [Gemmatimonadota bacterium]
MRLVRRSSAVLYIGSLALAVYACETSRRIGGVQPDTQSPTITLTNAGGDTQDIAGGLRFNVQANDNLGLKTIDLTFSGGLIGQLDTLFTTEVKTYNVGHTLTFSGGSGAGGLIQIVGRAVDGNGNFAEDTVFIYLQNIQALRVRLVLPSAGALASTGKGIPVDIIAVQAGGIAKIGYLVAPANAVTNPTAPPTDSIVYSTPYADSVEYVDTLVVVPSSGTFNIIGFAEDSAGRRGFSSVVTVTIQSVATDNTPPVVAHRVAQRVEVDDTIHVRAQDPSAISWIGFEVDTNNVRMKFDTVNVAAGNLSDITRNFSLGLQGLQPLPHTIVVKGYACDAAVARNCSFTNSTTLIPSAPVQSGATRGAKTVSAVPMAPQGLIDTIVVVAGITRPLPFGGRIADAIFNGNDSSLYLTNPTLGRVEIFQVANTSFVAAGIPTGGPVPWGIALWPRDTLGNYGDTIVVANSGGVELSIIDVRPGVRRLVWRHDLPDYLIETYKILLSPLREQIVLYDVSDRPQYVGTVCRVVTGTPNCHADSVFAIYSTTPTLSQPTPFVGKATVRMEKLINTTDTLKLFGHLFWELAGDSTLADDGRDTLRIEIRRGRPYNQQKTILTACAGVTVDLKAFGLGDSTYVRNSGNFTHAIVGEGGNVASAFARVVGYTTKARLIHDVALGAPCPTDPGFAGFTSDSGSNDLDRGMTPAIDVSDFISNTGVSIHSVATNFNGGTNLVRADSIYFLDEGMKLKGTAPAPLGAFGMDMNFNHNFVAGSPGTPTFGGAGNPNDRIAFSARADGNIDVWDTFFFGQIGTIVVRDPIIGPLRVARNKANTRQWLFGITGAGLVMIELPVVTNPFPTNPMWGPPVPIR